MSFVRPDARATLTRWAEPAVGAVLMLFGLWIASLGGLILIPMGLIIVALGAGWALLGWRRAMFRHDSGAPGLVELDEGRLRYLHPVMPGDISITDLTEVKLLSLRGRQVWRLKDLSGQALLVPADAAGADLLFDAFSALPGLSSADLVAALRPAPMAAATGTGLPVAATTTTERVVWRRRGTGMTRV